MNPVDLIRRVDGKNSCVPPQKLMGLWDYVRQAPDGDILEVGSWRGGTSLMLAASANQYKINFHTYICDTFEGIVKVTEKDNFHKNGDFGLGSTSKELVEDLMKEHDVKNVSIHKGIFPEDTGNEITSQKFGFVHVDVDVYQSHIDIFKWLEGRLVPGAIIAFDDYMGETCQGATAAVNEYFDGLADYQLLYDKILLWPGAYWHKARVIYNPNHLF